MPRRLVLKSDHSVEITRTKEIIPAACRIQDPRIVNGRIHFDYCGGSEVFWDDQRQERVDGIVRVFMDDDGEEYFENELEIIEQ